MSPDLQSVPAPLVGWERGAICGSAVMWFGASIIWMLVASRIGRHSGFTARPILLLMVFWVWAKTFGELLLGLGYAGAERLATYLQPVGAFSILALGVWVLAFHRAKWSALGIVREPTWLDLLIATFTEPFRADPKKPWFGRRSGD